jgi:hypothetical protein
MVNKSMQAAVLVFCPQRRTVQIQMQILGKARDRLELTWQKRQAGPDTGQLIWIRKAASPGSEETQ